MKGLIQLRKRIIALVLLILFSLSFLTSCDFDWSKPFHIHSYEETVIEPTCEEEGYTLKKCSECGFEVKTNYKDPLGHIEEIIKGYPKTCSTDGLSDGALCTRCGKTTKEQEIIPASHNWKYFYSVTPTCEKEGLSYKKECLDCHVVENKTEVVPKSGHDYDSHEESILNNTRCRHECSVCHKVTYDSLNVNYKANYDYVSFMNDSKYSKYKQTFINVYKELYEDCMRVLNSNKDYSSDDNVVATTKSSLPVTKNVLTAFTSSFLNNNPQFYFLSNMYSIKVDYYTGVPQQLLLKIDVDYYSHEVRDNINDNIKIVEREVYELVKDKTSDVLKAKAIHDYIANKTYYENIGGRASTLSQAHNIVGIFDNNDNTGSVCEGYANAYLYLSKFVGIESIMVSGFAESELHAWNYTKINGSWYGIDVTWDDQDKSHMLMHDYFLASKSEMENGTEHFDGGHQPFSDSIDEYQEGYILQTSLPTLSNERGYNGS